MGEGQILAQVKSVYQVGQACTGFGRHLNGLFKQAITAGKRVRAETSISSGAVSVSSAAAELAQLKLPTHNFADSKVCDVRLLVRAPVTPHLFGTLSRSRCTQWAGYTLLYNAYTFAAKWKCLGAAVHDEQYQTVSLCLQVCIIGAGKMSRLLVKHLASKGLSRLTILNRSLPRVEELMAEFPEVEFDVHLMPDLMQCIAASDTIFAASGSEDILVHANDVQGRLSCCALL